MQHVLSCWYVLFFYYYTNVYYHDGTTDGTGNKHGPYTYGTMRNAKKKPRDAVNDIFWPQVSCSFIFMFIFLWFFYTRESRHVITLATTTPTTRMYSKGMGTGLNDEGCQNPRLPHTISPTLSAVATRQGTNAG